MIITLHGLSTMHCNIKTEIRLAEELKFDALEIVESKLLRYLESGQKIADLKAMFEQAGISPVCINALKRVEAQDAPLRNDMFAQGQILFEAAEKLGCATVQIVPFCSLAGRPIGQILELTAINVCELADMAADYGVRLQLEPIAFSPINSLKLSLQLLERCQRSNVGMVVDFWHLWAGGDTAPKEVSALDKELIYGVHFCDGKKNTAGADWDEAALRSYLPGDGDIDITAWVGAVKATGYQGSWSSELYSPVHWEEDLRYIASETKKRMEKYIL